MERIVLYSTATLAALLACAAYGCSAEPVAPPPEEFDLDWDPDPELETEAEPCPDTNPGCDAFSTPCTFEEPEESFAAPGPSPAGLGDPLPSSGKPRVWPKGIIPYEFETDSNGNYLLDKLTRSRVGGAMTLWERQTENRIRFRKKLSTDKAYVTISVGGPVVTPFVGYRAGRVQRMEISSGQSSTVIRHELGHVIGLHHEHKRKDRGNYITVRMNNVLPIDNCAAQFSVCTDCNLLGAYDKRSVMHYRTSWDLSKCWNDPVIVDNDGSAINHIWTPSKKDATSVAKLYDRFICEGVTDAQFCHKLNKDCGSVTAKDNCGSSRTVDCGTCAAPDTCGGGGVANVCGSPGAPPPELHFENGSLVSQGLCIDIAGGSLDEGAKALNWECHGADNQDFRITKIRQLKVKHSLRCMEVVGESVPGAVVQQGACDTTQAQKWKFEEMAIVNSKSGKCLSIPGGNYAAGVTVGYGNCSGLPNTKFTYRPDTEEIRAGGFCLTPNGGAVDGNDVVLETCDGRKSQRWFQGRGGFVNRADTNQCMSVEGGSMYGTTIEVSDCIDTQGQRWGMRGPIRDYRADLCLQGGSDAGTQLTLATCDSSNAQRWTFWSR